MGNRTKPLDTRGIRDAVLVLAKELRERNGRDISSGVCISELDPARLASISIRLGRKLGVPVYTQPLTGRLVFDAGDYLLKGWAYRQKERFYSPGNKKRRMIAVDGEPTGQRERVIYFLRDMVDVFVEPIEQCAECDKEAVYVACFTDF